MEIDRRWMLRAAVVGGAAAAAAPLASVAQAADPAPTDGTTPVACAPVDAGVSLLKLFASESFNDEALFALGAASSFTAEVGEVLRIAQRINAKTGNPVSPDTAAFDAYVDEFGAYGDRLAKDAGRSRSHVVTSRNRSYRASMYAAQQLFFVLGTSHGSREQAVFETCQRRWLRAVDTLTPSVVHTQVSSPFGPIPVHFFPAPGSGRRPTLIISEGSDGQNVETMQFGVTAGLERGYNVVLFEGPGQMTPLFVRRVPFTPDWDKVVAPVLAWAMARPEVGKVALVGISFGGMLCARAAAKVTGLDAVVLEPAAYDMAKLWGDQESMELVRRMSKAPAKDREEARQGLNQGFQQAWAQMPRVDQFTIYKRGSIFDRKVQAEARAGKPLSDYYTLIERLLEFDFAADYRRITIPSMLLQNEGDEFFADQPTEAFAMLDKVPASRKVLVHLTAAKGASLHDQPVGPQVAQEVVFDWLDDQLS